MTETFATPDIAIERRDDGTTILRSRHAAPDPEPSITAVLRTRAAEHPDRPLAAQRDKDDRWVTLTYGEAKQRSDALAQTFTELGLGPEKPVMILSGNSLEHLLVSLAAYAARAPAMPISVAYSLMSADHARIRAIAELTEPGLVFADDAGPFGPALDALAAQVPTALVGTGDRRRLAAPEPGRSPATAARSMATPVRTRSPNSYSHQDRPASRRGSSTPTGCCVRTRR